MMRIGIEQEIVFQDREGNYLDFGNAEYSLFKKIVDIFPYFENDDAVFECKSLERVPKRCYVEGFERHDLDGNLVETVPKGLEIRTLPHFEIDTVVDEFSDSFAQTMRAAAHFGLSPLLTSRNPFKTSVVFSKPLNPAETAMRTEKELAIALSSMLSHGIHVNASMSDWSHEQMIALVQKVNYYIPFIIPFSFSSPFYDGKAFAGLSCRNYFRAEKRQLVQLYERGSSEVLEFRGFDACGDARLLKSLLTLFKGFLLDKTLNKRSLSQDPERLKQSSLSGFEDQAIKDEGLIVLDAARAALRQGGSEFDQLETMLHTNDSYAARMKSLYFETRNIIGSISNQYNYQKTKDSA